MTKRHKRFPKRFYSGMFLFILQFSLLCILFTTPAFASETEVDNSRVVTEKSNIAITDFTITNTEGEIPEEGFDITKKVSLNLGWDASSYQNNLKEGDYFIVTLPKELKFPKNHEACNFDLKAPDGTQIVAKAVVSPKENGGGTIKVAFTNYVEDKYNIKGTIKLSATINVKEIPQYGNVELTISVGVSSSSVTIPIPKPDPNIIVDEIINKWANPKLTEEGYVTWAMRINHKKATLTNVVISDQLSAENGNLDGIEYIADEFWLEEVELDEYGNLLNVISRTNVSADIQLGSDKKSFIYNIGTINGKQYILTYQSTYKQGLKLNNTAKLNSAEMYSEKQYSFHDVSSGGDGSGSLFGKIKIIKVDATNTEIKLLGARFLITSVSDPNQSFELTTDENGEAVSGILIPGQYVIKEITAPDGYILDGKEYTVEVTSSEATIQTITNNPTPKPDPKPDPEPDPPSINLPQTGDNFNIEVWCGLALFSFIGLMVNLVKAKKLNHSGRHK